MTAHGTGTGEPPITLGGGSGELVTCLGGCFLGFGDPQFGLIGTRVDFVQQGPLLDDLPILEVDFVQVAPDAGAHFDRRNCHDVAFIVVVIDDFMAQGLTDGNGGRRCFRDRSGLVAPGEHAR